jgi:hypothetical protein
LPGYEVDIDSLGSEARPKHQFSFLAQAIRESLPEGSLEWQRLSGKPGEPFFREDEMQRSGGDTGFIVFCNNRLGLLEEETEHQAKQH